MPALKRAWRTMAAPRLLVRSTTMPRATPRTKRGARAWRPSGGRAGQWAAVKRAAVTRTLIQARRVAARRADWRKPR